MQNISEWMREVEQDELLHLDDEYRSKTGVFEMKINAVGLRCDSKMTASGKLACVWSGCSCMATHKVAMQRNANNVDVHHACAKHAEGRKVIEMSEKGFVGHTTTCVGGWVNLRVVTWEKRGELC